MMPDERPPELEIYLGQRPELPWNRAEDFIQGPPEALNKEEEKNVHHEM